MNLSILPFILLSVLCSSTSQIALKIGAKSLSPSLTPSISTLFAVLFNPYIFGGILLQVVALLLWIYVLKFIDVSLAYPFISLGFVFVLIISALFLNESITLVKAAGIVVIILGIILLSRSTLL